MEEQLISFETAKLAKEKGFDIPQPKGFYNHGGKELLLWVDSENHNGQKDFLAYAPTQSLLQKWLREEHNIDVLPISFKQIKGKYHCLLIHGSYEYYIQKGWFDAYEEAFELGLIQGLKQI